jgi:hypothetical protein
MVVSFRVTQYAHQTGSAYSTAPPKTVDGLVPKDHFPAEPYSVQFGDWTHSL